MGLFTHLKQMLDVDRPQYTQQHQQHYPTPPRPPSGSHRSYFLAQGYTSQSTAPALVPIQWPYPGNLPPGALVFSFTHPDPNTDEPTRFLLECLPDPVGIAFHAMMFVRECLTLPGTNPPWRHRLVNIALKDEDGLAWACGSDITISLRWARDILASYRNGKRDMAACCFEFKGVILHELVHIVQNNGSNSAPSWLIESMADSVRYLGNLGAKHWRKPGEGRRDKGWEDKYDAGALFLCWLAGLTPPVDGPPGQQTQPAGAYPTQAPGYGQQQQQQQQHGQQYTTAYPANYNPQQGYGPPPTPAQPFQQGTKARRGPFPDIVRHIDNRLRTERYSDNWWYEMTGAPLEVLWKEYLDYYGRR